ncbi:hypothetical protein EU408_22965 [Salmonella enterica subsp. enterica]|uniref:Uncharacterized protein n=1 Tax=Salmonella enterica subsp. enterica serovar Ouagadougou TaxID=2564899 RepID=A0A5I0D656_SALET|nr:hypothetical protein [Salmonella enterica subsp. enterica serovar Ouagadougou]ECI6612949.1 hypothetical protein [Salmonella enterica subsp. enterica]EBR9514328.1 hypothetical protein [Salmonella enterica subsp. enterica serovar Ouagadougou]EBV0638036.1 hypothetical protein [Salmonella enterica subsp. enterica serovar Ouagadougou]EBV0756569.1 hypothetical protein [Salmonella enterica subsp. enterica serovar Ouagadougou]
MEIKVMRFHEVFNSVMNKFRGNFLVLILIFILFDSCIRNKHECLVLVPLFFISDVFSEWIFRTFKKQKISIKIVSLIFFYGLLAVLTIGHIRTN